MITETKYNDSMAKVREYFGDKVIVSRQDILAYLKETDDTLPAVFWANARVARGTFDLSTALDGSRVAVTAPVHTTNNVVVMPTSKHNQHTSDMHNRFDRDLLIPTLKDTYVEWGNYSTVVKLLNTSNFFTLYVSGDSGSGKNEMVAQACAKLNRPLVRVSVTRETKEEHLIGSKTLIDGSIVYEEGPVVWAAKTGAVLLIDEISAGDPNELMCLQSVLEGEAFFVKSANVMITPVEGFCIIATDNTKGRGSDSARYIGTNILNDAFLERFEMTMEQGYPTEKIETAIINKLMHKLGLDDQKFATQLVSWVQAIRKTYVEEGLDEHITTRRACHIVKTFYKIKDVEKSIELCVNRFDETTKMAMLSLWEKMTPTEEKTE